jgi:L-lactate dehydrogenase complex protein LldF
MLTYRQYPPNRYVIMSTIELIEEFKVRAILHGSAVTLVNSEQQALEYITGLVNRHGIKVAVKARSGIADRLGLRSHLEKGRVKVAETELVGWVLQLSRGKEVPLERVAALLSSAAGHSIEARPAAILTAAKVALKEAYTGADLGISEADFGIAETGTLMSLESGPNDRLAVVLPRLHLSLLAFDRVVASLADAAGKFRESSGGIPGHKLPAFISQVAGHNRTGTGYRTSASKHAHTGEEHILIIQS